MKFVLIPSGKFMMGSTAAGIKEPVKFVAKTKRQANSLIQIASETARIGDTVAINLPRGL